MFWWILAPIIIVWMGDKGKGISFIYPCLVLGLNLWSIAPSRWHTVSSWLKQQDCNTLTVAFRHFLDDRKEIHVPSFYNRIFQLRGLCCKIAISIIVYWFQDFNQYSEGSIFSLSASQHLEGKPPNVNKTNNWIENCGLITFIFMNLSSTKFSNIFVLE